MQASPFRMSQLTPPEELHTVAYVFTNGGPQMRSDEVNPVAKGHQSKKKHSRKSKRHSSSKRRKSMSLWLDKQEDAAVTHNIHEEKINNSQPATNNILSTAPPWLDATITHNICEERMENGQSQTDKVFSTVSPWLVHRAAAGIPSMSTRDLYITATHNVHEAKMKNDQQTPDNSLSTVPPGCTNLSGAGISSRSTRGLYSTVIHDIQEEEMENGQIPPDGLLSNSDLPELINMTGHRMPPKALGSFSYDFTSLSKDELLYKPDSNEFAVGIKNYSVSTGDPPVTAMPSVETVPNTPQMSPAMAKKINDDIKYQLMKEVRRFGQNYERIFILLEEVQGSMKVKRQFVEFTIKEAARFKKVVLIQQLEKVLKEIDSHCHLRKVKHMRKK
uniref:INTS6/SAGE1/DDX26B/CT45 C-terminal domain-containing protein n=1 Tax=Mandrillus leucophaeus TaxID=9568 RepID=A0A2K5YQW6_MANLE